MKLTLYVLFASTIALVLVASSAALADPTVSLRTYDAWAAAITSGTVHPYTHWDTGLEAHYPGQSANYRVPTLNAMDGFILPPEHPYPFTEDRPGIVMSWGAIDEEENVIGAWEYEYGQDPDLTGQIIGIGVHPPAGINSISMGLIDANGKVKSWDWGVDVAGGLMHCHQYHFIIDPMGGAGQARSTSFSCDAGFDITQVKGLIFDERGQWLNLNDPSPLGFNRPWNYWKDLTVSPEPSSMLALVGGLVGLGSLAWRRRK